jgi:hypothetical protein
MADAGHSVVPSRDELQTLSVRLMREYQPRFDAADINLAIGRVRSLKSRGIGVEINGDWHSFRAAHWSFVRRNWVLASGLAELEGAIRDYLETQLRAGPTG